MRKDRQAKEVRDIKVTPGYSRHAEGSALVEWGKNRILATLTIENKLPPHLRNKNQKGPVGGWLTAEYALLPRSTQERTQRERLYSGGRTQEIQRLIGRAMRSVTDLSLFNNKTLTIDVDVLDADGGTRCAGILAAYAAMHNAANALITKGTLDEWPLRYELAAVSVGLVRGEMLVDLEYSEDMIAEVDLNVVATADGQLVEVQGGGEEKPMPAESYLQLVQAGLEAVKGISDKVRGSLK